jgi:arylsulfatase A-like enzyme
MQLFCRQARRILLLLVLWGLPFDFAQGRLYPAGAEESIPRLRVYIVLIDGLGAESLSSQLTPTLWELTHGGKERATFYPQARAVMPTVTNVNHVSLMTGAYPAAHGITGNYYWDRRDRLIPTSLDRAELIEVETLFTVMEKDRAEIVSAGVFGKWKLADLFQTGGSQVGPDHLWGDMESEHEALDPHAGFAADERTMDEVLRTIWQKDPSLLFVNLPDVDRLSHLFGPDSHEARKGLLEADRQIERLVKFLKTGGLWQEVILMLTADHGFASAAPKAGNPYPSFSFGRELARQGIKDVVAVSDGGIEHIYLHNFDPTSSTLSQEEAERLKAVRDLALRQPEVDAALYRLVPALDREEKYSLDTTHADWRLSHPRAGELILVARPGYYFNDPFSPRTAGLRGHHGSPHERHIPMVITGGYPKIRAQIVQGGEPTENPDLGMTAAWLLGLREPHYLNGESVPEVLQGRVLSEAFAP